VEPAEPDDALDDLPPYATVTAATAPPAAFTTAAPPALGVATIAFAGALVRSSFPQTRNGEKRPTSNEAVPEIVRFLYVVGAVSVVVPLLIDKSLAVEQSPNVSIMSGVPMGDASTTEAILNIAMKARVRQYIRPPLHL
jgi:hypothetical protein